MNRVEWVRDSRPGTYVRCSPQLEDSCPQNARFGGIEGMLKVARLRSALHRRAMCGDRFLPGVAEAGGDAVDRELDGLGELARVVGGALALAPQELGLDVPEHVEPRPAQLEAL